MIGDAVRAIAGDLAEVEVLMGEGVDPHLYKPTRADMQRLQRARVVFYNGLHLEGKMEEALARLGETKVVVQVTGDLETHFQDRLLETDEGDGFDPHVWMDPMVWAVAVDTIRNTLVAQFAPSDTVLAQGIVDRAGEYNRQLKRIDWYCEQVLVTVPNSRRVLVTAHDAFGYFARRHDFEVLGVQGLSTESEAGLADIERIVSVLVEREVPAVFVETSVSDRNVKALIDGAAARGHRVRIGGSLFSDAMGPSGTYEGTLVGMIDHNVTTITNALDGEAPDRGIDGSLAVSTRPDGDDGSE
jgi:manganese/zinc/iron transport system substrate-binding protein